MSEQAEVKVEEKAKKGGGKMIIIAVLALAMAGGGYFGMASKKGPEKPKGPELGDMVEMTPEFIVNLREREVFLRASVSFQLDKNNKDVHLGGDGGGHGGASAPSPEMTALRDAITERLSTLSVNDIKRADFYARLRRVLADDANRVLALLSHKEDAAADKKGDKKKEDDHGHAEPPKKASLYSVVLDPSKLEHPDWDSDKGPILKVYITSFATQRE
ncbi:MAG: flagellar basal body-associated FliL family protein [Chthonomonas sp.]|nr:flagellar basal body-associated FliL family protein [Chthonomonas sp.]